MEMDKLRAGMESIDKACVGIENAESSFTKDIVNREINNHISFSRDMQVQATIGGVVARIVVDTGAEISLITEVFLYKMSEETQRPAQFVEKSSNIMGVDGNHCRILGTTILTTDFFNRKVKVEYQGVEKAPYDGITGRNFISRHIDRISYAEQRMYFKSTNPTKGGYLRKRTKRR